MPRTTSPLRAGGLVLLGLAVVFATLGVLTPSDDAGAPAAQPDSTLSSAAAPSSPESSPVPAPTSSEARPAPSTGAPQAASPSTRAAPRTRADPGAEIAPAPAPGESPPSAAEPGRADPRTQVDVVVLNNSTIRGLAAQAAADVQADGWTVAETGNFTGRIPTTTVYHDDGQQVAAQALASDVGARVEPRFGGLPSTAPGIVLVVTQDYAG